MIYDIQNNSGVSLSYIDVLQVETKKSTGPSNSKERTH